jgi:hypothetical protein
MRPYHKKAWTCAIIVTFILFFYTFSFAQTESIKGVQFKDGSIIYGKVIKMNVYEIHIETKDGKKISSKFDDVVSFIKDTGVDAKQESKTPVEETVSQDNVATFIKADEKESPKTLSKARHTWEMGPEISYIEYKEPDVMSQKGTMYGIGAAYSYHNGVMIKVAGRYSYGQVDYQNSGTLNNIDDIIFEIRALGGYDFKISSSFTMTPFIGFGYRYLKDDSAGRITSTGAKGYLRESNYYYSPIGIEAVNVFDKGWSAGVILEYDYFWKGMQKSYLSNSDAGLNDVENNQNGGYGVRGSIIIKKQTDRVFYAIEPFIRYWNIDNSDIQNVTYYGIVIDRGLEPKNESTEIGVKFMIGF